MCTPGSSAPRRVARHSRDRQNPSTNAAPTKMPHSSSRRETSLEIAKAIGLWPLRAPSRPPRTATQPSPHTTSRATWDSGISLIQAAGSTLKVDKKLADVQVTHYAGVIIPCMTTINVPPSAVKIVEDMHSRNLPVAAQNGGVVVLDAAGVLEGRNYSTGEDVKSYVRDGVLKGVGVVQDGDIVTSGVCPYSAQTTGLKDGTDELVTTFAAMLKK